MSDKKIAKDLDAALEGAEPTDEVESLVEVAARLEDGMDVDAPTASRERALFTRGVGLRKKGFNPLRVVSPALAVVGIVAIIAFVAGRALPGQTLYPVREALDSVGSPICLRRSSRTTSTTPTGSLCSRPVHLAATSLAAPRVSPCGP